MKKQHSAEGVKPTTFYTERVRTVPGWRAWQLSSVALASLALLGYWVLTSTTGEARRVALATPIGTPPQFTLLLAGRDIAYCYHHQPCKDQNSLRARELTRTDTIMLMKVNGPRVDVLSIPRDTQAGPDGRKINSAYASGGPEHLVERIEDITGERIDYYAVVRTDYVADVIDALGGLDVNVPAKIDFDDYAAKLHVHLQPGEQHLDGKQAVAYLRIRKGVGDDYGRMDHQKAAVTQLVSKLRTPKGLGAVPVIVSGINDRVETNADPALLNQMMPFLSSYRLSFATLPTNEIPGSTNLMPDREALARLLGHETLTHARDDQATVRVVDASGADLGAKVAWALRLRGFRVTNVETTAPSNESTQVFTLDRVRDAQNVSQVLNVPRLQGLRFPVNGGEVGVFLGRDAATRYAELSRIQTPVLENP